MRLQSLWESSPCCPQPARKKAARTHGCSSGHRTSGRIYDSRPESGLNSTFESSAMIGDTIQKTSTFAIVAGSAEVPARAHQAAQQMRHVDEPLRNQMAHIPLAL